MHRMLFPFPCSMRTEYVSSLSPNSQFWLIQFEVLYTVYMGFPHGTSSKEPACQCRRHNRRGFDPWVGKIPWRRAWQPTPVFFPGELQGQVHLSTSDFILSVCFSLLSQMWPHGALSVLCLGSYPKLR